MCTIMLHRVKCWAYEHHNSMISAPICIGSSKFHALLFLNVKFGFNSQIKCLMTSCLKRRYTLWHYTIIILKFLDFKEMFNFYSLWFRKQDTINKTSEVINKPINRNMITFNHLNHDKCAGETLWCQEMLQCLLGSQIYDPVRIQIQ